MTVSGIIPISYLTNLFSTTGLNKTSEDGSIAHATDASILEEAWDWLGGRGQEIMTNVYSERTFGIAACGLVGGAWAPEMDADYDAGVPDADIPDSGDGGDADGGTACDSSPGTFNLEVPTNGAVDVSLSPVLDWADSVDPDTDDVVSYRVEVSLDETFSSPTVYSGISESQFSIPDVLDNDQTYYWRVIAIDLCDQETISDVYSFTTIAYCAEPPAAFSLTEPADAATDVSIMPTFDWTDSIDSDPGDVVTYTLQVDTDAGFSTPTIFGGLTDSTYDIGSSDALANDQTYFWRVIGLDGCSNEVYSTEEFSFTTRIAPICQKIDVDISVSDVDSFNSQGPSLVWTGTEFGVAWVDLRDGDPEVYFRRISNIGALIGSDIRITSSVGGATDVSMVWTGTEYGLSWADSRDGNWEIYFRRVSAAGVPIDADVRVTDFSGTSDHPSLYWTGAEYGVAWSDDRDGNSEIYFRAISNIGLPIGTDVNITSHVDDSLVPSLVWTGGEYGLCWRDNRDGNWEVYFRLITSTGVPIGSVARVTNALGDSYTSGDRSLVWTGSEYGLTWRDDRDANSEIYFRRISNVGVPIDSDIRVTNDTNASIMPSLAWTGSEFSVGWYDNRDGNNEIYFRQLSNVGVPLASDARMTNEIAESINPSLVWTSGTEYGVSWQDNRDGNQEIYFARIGCEP